MTTLRGWCSTTTVELSGVVVLSILRLFLSWDFLGFGKLGTEFSCIGSISFFIEMRFDRVQSIVQSN